MSAVRLMLGTLTALPVAAPSHVDRRVAGRAMTLAPVGGAVLAVVVALPLLLLEEYAGSIGPLLLAALSLAGLAVLTRAIHLDGLADTADGLGSGRRGAGALEVMRRSDIGPFGVVTLLLALLVQTAALAQLLATGHGVAALVAALVVSRTVLPVLCTRAFPPARRDGLGQSVAGTVSPPQAGLAVALGAVLAGVLTAVALTASHDMSVMGPVLAVGLAGVVALGAGVALAAHASRRFGGVTGDVYGAAVEVTFTTLLVLAALLLPGA
ncbi:adenosylcobinamide-GDP ribazoletransferase [Nocardioides sp.]|uniref:adenosylcobinamide-GDP ribazoletransferase n=1 Tax=Nocardioides sp. TaxID=35761 RepID=UPI002734B993|nr:adenosylcobinamide-GDP ribazoletransferase [Nocardioides sp.]MDP3890070.1 adenosylcobinamide-GDP ribazoletransferase [Nocardioides sp.]